MGIVAVTARDGRAEPQVPLAPLLSALPQGAPVTILIHGYRYCPGQGRADPARALYAHAPQGQPRRVLSWPRRLGYTRGVKGLALGFGWPANTTLWAAHAEAALAGAALAHLVRDLRQTHAGPIHIFAHSLGARVALAALPDLEAHDIGRMILLSAAEFQATAQAMLDSPAGRTAEVLNVTSRENDLFDFVFERLIGGPFARMGAAAGEGLTAPNVANLQIDSAAHRSALRAMGFPLAPPARLVCHWSGYTRPGLFPLYRAFLHRPAALPLARLRAALAPPAPRWSRLRTRGLPEGPALAH
jgi:hypothetical protein